MMSPAFRLISLWLFLLFLGQLGCELAPVQPNPERPRDPWVFRSVLDQRPRMITVALDSLCYVAYDASLCRTYKVWQGGVHLNGAAYNNIKTIQPSSWGHTYAVDSLHRGTWRVKNSKGTRAVAVRFKGYSLGRNRVEFHYQLITPEKDTLDIWERPEWTGPHDEGTYFFEQHFTTRHIPPDTEIYLQTLGRQKQLPSNGKVVFKLPLEPTEEVKTAPIFSQKGDRGKLWLERSGCNTCHEENEATIGPAYLQIAERYAGQIGATQQLIQKVKQGGKGNWGEVPMIPHPQHNENDIRTMVRYILSMNPAPKPARNRSARRRGDMVTDSGPQPQPGFGVALEGLHPSLNLQTIRPAHFRPRVGGMDFLPDSSLLISTWDSIGAVYKLRQVVSGDSGRVTVERIAQGLHEPLGLKVVGEDIFVLQKQELTQLIDKDGDGITDEYRAICNTFGATADFHEFSYGLEYKDGYFYANLGLAMRLMSHEHQHPDRGRTIRISREGNYEVLNFGLRQANGIGLGVDSLLFVTDNQGKWLPANKLIQIERGAFYGSRAVIKDSLPSLKMVPPTVWLPQDDIGNSPGEPILMRFGPYAGQMIHGEVTHGGIKRTFLEKVNGRWQGCVFRFSQGLEAGIIRLCYGPDGALYAGGVGMNGNWGWKGAQYGLQKLVYNGKSVFEMLAVRAQPGGLEIEFTEDLEGVSASDFLVQQWWYLPTENYGGPKMDLENLTIQGIKLSANKRRVHLNLPGIKQGHVVYIKLNAQLRSARGSALWAGDAWYTMNQMPE